MAEEMSVKVGLAFEGMQQNTQQMANMMTSMKGIAVAVGISAAIWQGLEPLLKPVLMMFKLLLMLLLIPLIPYIKKMVMNLANTAKSVSSAQQAAGGTGMDAFMAGIGALVSSPTIWGLVGALIVGGMIMSLGSKSLTGVLLTALTISLIFNAVDEKTVKGALKNAGLAGLSGAIAIGIITGNPIAGLIGGAVIFSLALGLSAKNLVSEEDLKKLFEGAGLAAIAVALAVGIATGNPILAIVAGTLTFALSLIFDLKRKEKDPLKSVMDQFGEKTYQPWELEGTRQVDMSGMKMNVIDMPEIDLSSFDLSPSLNNSTNDIISSLNKIPKEIVTIHRIVTVTS